MKTPEPPRSSKGKGKVEASASTGDSPMERFRRLSEGVLTADLEKVRKAEQTSKRGKKPKR